MTKSKPSLIERIRREPLFHFLGLAVLLFVANAFFSGDERELITVDTATQEYLIEQQQSLVLRELSEQEKVETIERFIEDDRWPCCSSTSGWNWASWYLYSV